MTAEEERERFYKAVDRFVEATGIIPALRAFNDRLERLLRRFKK